MQSVSYILPTTNPREILLQTIAAKWPNHRASGYPSASAEIQTSKQIAFLALGCGDAPLPLLSPPPRILISRMRCKALSQLRRCIVCTCVSCHRTARVSTHARNAHTSNTPCNGNEHDCGVSRRSECKSEIAAGKRNPCEIKCAMHICV